MGYKSNFIPTYLKYKYICSSFRFQVGSGARSGFFFQLSRIRIRGKKCRILIPEKKFLNTISFMYLRWKNNQIFVMCYFSPFNWFYTAGVGSGSAKLDFFNCFFLQTSPNNLDNFLTPQLILYLVQLLNTFIVIPKLNANQ